VNVTWDWLIAVAAWVFLFGTVMVAASAVPRIGKRYPRLLILGFLLGILSFVLVLAAWVVPRLPGFLTGG
jgi:hypothetical protein